MWDKDPKENVYNFTWLGNILFVPKWSLSLSSYLFPSSLELFSDVKEFRTVHFYFCIVIPSVVLQPLSAQSCVRDLEISPSCGNMDVWRTKELKTLAEGAELSTDLSFAIADTKLFSGDVVPKSLLGPVNSILTGLELEVGKASFLKGGWLDTCHWVY